MYAHPYIDRTCTASHAAYHVTGGSGLAKARAQPGTHFVEFWAPPRGHELADFVASQRQLLPKLALGNARNAYWKGFRPLVASVLVQNDERSGHPERADALKA